MVQVHITGVKKSQTNVFVKHEFKIKSTLRKNGNCIGYMRSFTKIQFSTLQTNKNTSISFDTKMNICGRYSGKLAS